MFGASTFLEIDKYPHSEFILKKITGAESLADNEWVPLQLHGAFTLHGVTKEIIAPATAKWISKDASPDKREQLFVRAFFQIKWKDYKIDVPEGQARTFAGDGAGIQVELKYQPKQTPAKKNKSSKS